MIAFLDGEKYPTNNLQGGFYKCFVISVNNVQAEAAPRWEFAARMKTYRAYRIP